MNLSCSRYIIFKDFVFILCLITVPERTHRFPGTTTPSTTARCPTNTLSANSDLKTTEPNPIKHQFPILHGPWTIQPCDKEVFSPMITELFPKAWITTLSWMLQLSLIEIELSRS